MNTSHHTVSDPHQSCPDARCPDCAGMLFGDHADTCPLADQAWAQVANDRAWFEQHPRTRLRVRPPCWAEVEVRRALRLVPVAVVRIGRDDVPEAVAR